jgi:hypothetical protein
VQFFLFCCLLLFFSSFEGEGVLGLGGKEGIVLIGFIVDNRQCRG